MLVCFIVSPTVNAAALPTQEAAPQTNVQFQARNLLDQGVQAFKNGQYDEATQDFLRETARPQAFECPAVSGHGVCLAIHHKKHIHLRPLDPEPYYWIGVIDWTLAYRANGLLRAQLNLSMRGKQLSDTAPLPPELRDVYVREYGAMIDEGIEALKHAIALRPNYDDAMAYLNLLYRRKADTVTSDIEREELVKMADDLIDRVKEIKQSGAEQPNQP